ncbi:MAG: hypothetical protein RLZZ427_370 [Pseudomonadota bacterium]|jgi:hypothetical protein
MQVVRIDGLPPDPLAAAAHFHAHFAERLAQADGDLVLVFPPADHTHRGWRVAAVQALARGAVPRRVNAVAANDPAAITAAQAYLASAPGVTGHYLPLDDGGTGVVIASPA